MPEQNRNNQSNDELQENGAEQAPFSPYPLGTPEEELGVDERLLAQQQAVEEERALQEELTAAQDLARERALAGAAEEIEEQETEEEEEEEAEESEKAGALEAIQRARELRRKYVIWTAVLGFLFNPIALTTYLIIFCVIFLYGFLGVATEKIVEIPGLIVDGISAEADSAKEGLTRGAEDFFVQ